MGRIGLLSNIRDPDDPRPRRRSRRAPARSARRRLSRSPPRSPGPRVCAPLLRAALSAAGATGTLALARRGWGLALPVSRGAGTLRRRGCRLPYRVRVLRSVPDVHGVQHRHGQQLLRRSHRFLERDAAGSALAHRRSGRERPQRELRSGVRRPHLRSRGVRRSPLRADRLRARGRLVL